MGLLEDYKSSHNNIPSPNEDSLFQVVSLSTHQQQPRQHPRGGYEIEPEIQMAEGLRYRSQPRNCELPKQPQQEFFPRRE